MYAPRNDAVLDRIVSALVERLQPNDVYLFGSRARGENVAGSDYDLLVVLASSNLPGHRRDREALKALRDVRAPVDVLVLTRDEFEAARTSDTSLVSTVLREGVHVHAA